MCQLSCLSSVSLQESEDGSTEAAQWEWKEPSKRSKLIGRTCILGPNFWSNSDIPRFWRLLLSASSTLQESHSCSSVPLSISSSSTGSINSAVIERKLSKSNSILLVLRLYRLPKNLDKKLHSVVRQSIFIAILLHLGNAVWNYGNSQIFGGDSVCWISKYMS